MTCVHLWFTLRVPKHWIFQSSLNRRKHVITTDVWLWSITSNTYNLLRLVLLILCLFIYILVIYTVTSLQSYYVYILPVICDKLPYTLYMLIKLADP